MDLLLTWQRNKIVDGIIYTYSSFGCGIDSVILRAYKKMKMKKVPILEKKLDEQREKLWHRY